MLLAALTLSAVLLAAQSLSDEEIAAFNTYRFPGRKERNTGVETQKHIVDNGDGTLTLTSNNIPNHDTWPFPNTFNHKLPFDVPASIGENMHKIKIDKNPTFAETPLGCLPYGTSGWAVSGGSITSPYTSAKECQDATIAEAEINDMCFGHPTPWIGGSYHYHSWSPCIHMETCGEESPLYGVMMDGFPIYGPIDENGKQLTRKDLDECGGRVYNDGSYRYHLTADFPYTPSCLKGKIRRDMGVKGNLWLCACPYSDELLAPIPPDPSKVSGLREYLMKYSLAATLGYPPRVKEPSCRFDGDGEYATCQNVYNKSYLMPMITEWKKEEFDLIPCCPKGEDCGDSCLVEDAHHKKSWSSKCVVEKRTVERQVTRKKTEEEMEKERAEKQEDMELGLEGEFLNISEE